MSQKYYLHRCFNSFNEEDLKICLSHLDRAEIVGVAFDVTGHTMNELLNNLAYKMLTNELGVYKLEWNDPLLSEYSCSWLYNWYYFNVE